MRQTVPETASGRRKGTVTDCNVRTSLIRKQHNYDDNGRPIPHGDPWSQDPVRREASAPVHHSNLRISLTASADHAVLPHPLSCPQGGQSSKFNHFSLFHRLSTQPQLSEPSICTLNRHLLECVAAEQ